MFSPTKNYIKYINPIKGYGVFAGINYNKGDVVDYCFFIEISRHIDVNLEHTTYGSHLNPDKDILLLNNGSLFNHSDNNNIYNTISEKYPPDRITVFVAKKNIKKDEELTSFYGENFFKDRKLSKISEKKCSGGFCSTLISYK